LHNGPLVFTGLWNLNRNLLPKFFGWDQTNLDALPATFTTIIASELSQFVLLTEQLITGFSLPVGARGITA
jgi:hypothetical protein